MDGLGLYRFWNLNLWLVSRSGKKGVVKYPESSKSNAKNEVERVGKDQPSKGRSSICPAGQPMAAPCD